MRESNQAEMIKKMTNKQVYESVYLSQLILFIIAIILLFILPIRLEHLVELLQFNWDQILTWSLGTAAFVVIIDLLLWRFLPENWIDDGGINERIFKNASFKQVLIISLLVAISEELLFRGILQTSIGYVPACIIFALIHFRYIYKPVLLMFVTLLSFLLGWQLILTNNLIIPIMTHFFIDFFLALLLKNNFFTRIKGK